MEIITRRGLSAWRMHCGQGPTPLFKAGLELSLEQEASSSWGESEEGSDGPSSIIDHRRSTAVVGKLVITWFQVLQALRYGTAKYPASFKLGGELS